MELLVKILNYVLDSFLHIWPYLVITIPFAVAVQLSGASKLLNRIIGINPLATILIATAVGAFSPFCSCGVIPVIAALLIGGIPIAPVMSFWIASPSMDPEIFFLSTSVIGLKMSVWRLAATFFISLCAGLVTHLAEQNGWLKKQDILALNLQKNNKSGFLNMESVKLRMRKIFSGQGAVKAFSSQPIVDENVISADCCSCSGKCNPMETLTHPACCDVETTCCSESTSELSFRQRLVSETWKALLMTTKFMALAFLINALILFCLPKDLFNGVLLNDGPFAIVIATLVGIPVYTSNITAIPLVSGLMALGMNPGAALAFLIAGPVTTLPAMSAVWGLVNRKVFLLYLIFPFAGAILFGWLYSIFQ